MTNAIEAMGLQKRYGSFTLGPLSFTLPGGCVLGLLGENGAGKTTTLALLLGAVRPDGGTVRVLGHDFSEDPRRWKEDIGVVFDEPGLPEPLTAGELGRVFAGIYRQWDAAEYDRLLRRLELPKDKPFKTFSRGMRMKLGIAAALSHRAKLLLLDEPTGGLDPVVRDEVVTLFADFTRDEDHAILISSHIVSDLEKLCDYVAFLHKGQMTLYSEKDALLDEYALWHCTAAELAALPEEAVAGARVTEFGAEAAVRRSAVPRGASLSPVTLEELFVLSTKKAAAKEKGDQK